MTYYNKSKQNLIKKTEITMRYYYLRCDRFFPIFVAIKFRKIIKKNKLDGGNHACINMRHNRIILLHAKAVIWLALCSLSIPQ